MTQIQPVSQKQHNPLKTAALIGGLAATAVGAYYLVMSGQADKFVKTLKNGKEHAEPMIDNITAKAKNFSKDAKIKFNGLKLDAGIIIENVTEKLSTLKNSAAQKISDIVDYTKSGIFEIK